MKKSGIHIHIVGSSPRTGTTLMTELMVNCFNIDAFEEHELSIFKAKQKGYNIYCTKNPRDVLVAPELLFVDKKLWIINMERDPRDIIVSCHKNRPEVFWSNLRLWKMRRNAIEKASVNKRFITVRYEDLVKAPDDIQAVLHEKMPFLEKKAKFSAFHKMADPSGKSINALSGLRPVNAQSIGGWRNHLPRVAAQLNIHGPIDRELIRLGYEKDHSWIKVLEKVTPENGVSYWPEKRSFIYKRKKAVSRKIKLLIYALRVWLRP